jgi:hypothetical protein
VRSSSMVAKAAERIGLTTFAVGETVVS